MVHLAGGNAESGQFRRGLGGGRDRAGGFRSVGSIRTRSIR